MFLFKFEAIINNTDVFVVVAAKDDESAFRLAEIEIERNYMKLPEIKEISMVEKKPIKKGTGFVL
ncbi:DUF3906 family protein [Bacillus alkalicellulosilyticus]|uniref:DUF3906 family protein n=1 Tax=Alkalihalobacterium alkalicellulosilyticum TaxID=1912214 RepID=UPI0009966D14|nr:DUF3906 family protein [Bacillus alkalicellulosilyticus]